MTTQIQQTSGVQSRNDASGVNDPGSFTAYDDGTAVFCGDGAITCAQATGYYLDWLATNGSPEMAPFVGNPDAARFGGQITMQKNPQLGLSDPNDPIPRGALMDLDGMSLKQLLSGFANRLDDLAKLVASTSGGLQGNSALSRTTGQVPSVGLPLPVG